MRVAQMNVIFKKIPLKTTEPTFPALSATRLPTIIAALALLASNAGCGRDDSPDMSGGRVIFLTKAVTISNLRVQFYSRYA